MGHLNEEKLKRLLVAPKDEPELFKHLEQGCDECEAFLAQSEHPLLDGATDAMLLSLRPAAVSEDARADATFQKVLAQTQTQRQTQTAARTARAPKSFRWMYAAAAVLIIVIAGALALRPRFERSFEQSVDGLKGGPVLTLELDAAVRAADGTVTRVERGQAVPGAGALLLRYHASEAATARVVVVRQGVREDLGPISLEAGTHDLSRDGQLVGISLESEKGPFTVRLEAVDSRGKSSNVELDVTVRP
jgi:hypothetical protein